MASKAAKMLSGMSDSKESPEDESSEMGYDAKGENVEHNAVYDRVFDTLKAGDREGFRAALAAAVFACMEDSGEEA